MKHETRGKGSEIAPSTKAVKDIAIRVNKERVSVLAAIEIVDAESIAEN